jgi:hypothetical protein
MGWIKFNSNFEVVFVSMGDPLQGYVQVMNGMGRLSTGSRICAMEKWHRKGIDFS